jgi:hypothetical protein
MVQITAERIELPAPEMLVVRDPGRGGLHGRGIELAAHDPPLLGPRDEAGGLQHGEVLDEARQRHVVRRRQLADAGPAAAELLQHAPPRRVGQRGEHEIELGIFFINHLV